MILVKTFKVIKMVVCVHFGNAVLTLFELRDFEHFGQKISISLVVLTL